MGQHRSPPLGVLCVVLDTEIIQMSAIIIIYWLLISTGVSLAVLDDSFLGAWIEDSFPGVWEAYSAMNKLLVVLMPVVVFVQLVILE